MITNKGAIRKVPFLCGIRGGNRRNDSLGQSGKKGEVKQGKKGEKTVKSFSPDNSGSFIQDQKLQEQSECLLSASL